MWRSIFDGQVLALLEVVNFGFDGAPSIIGDLSDFARPIGEFVFFGS